MDKTLSIVAIIITTTLCFTLLAAILVPVYTGIPVTDKGREIIGKMIIALIALLSNIIGLIAGILLQSYKQKKSNKQVNP